MDGRLKLRSFLQTVPSVWEFNPSNQKVFTYNSNFKRGEGETFVEAIGMDLVETLTPEKIIREELDMHLPPDKKVERIFNIPLFSGVWSLGAEGRCIYHKSSNSMINLATKEHEKRAHPKQPPQTVAPIQKPDTLPRQSTSLNSRASVFTPGQPVEHKHSTLTSS